MNIHEQSWWVFVIVAIAFSLFALFYSLRFLIKSKLKAKSKSKSAKQLYKYRLWIFLHSKKRTDRDYVSFTTRALPAYGNVYKPFIKFIRWYYRRPNSQTFRIGHNKHCIMICRNNIVGYTVKRFKTSVDSLDKST